MDSVGLDSVLQVKPKLDPWQQKLLMELKEKKSVDELLKMHSRFLQVSVTSALTRSHTTIIYIIYIIMKRTQKSNKASVCVSGVVCSGCHQVPDLLRVASALKAHAAHVADFQPAPTSSSLSHGSETRRHKTSEIWTSIYSAVSLTQAGIVQFVCSPPPRMPGWETMLYQKVTFVLLGNTRAVNRIRRQRSREGELEGSN